MKKRKENKLLNSLRYLQDMYLKNILQNDKS